MLIDDCLLLTLALLLQINAHAKLSCAFKPVFEICLWKKNTKKIPRIKLGHIGYRLAKSHKVSLILEIYFNLHDSVGKRREQKKKRSILLKYLSSQALNDQEFKSILDRCAKKLLLFCIRIVDQIEYYGFFSGSSMNLHTNWYDININGMKSHAKTGIDHIKWQVN